MFYVTKIRRPSIYTRHPIDAPPFPFLEGIFVEFGSPQIKITCVLQHKKSADRAKTIPGYSPKGARTKRTLSLDSDREKQGAPNGVGITSNGGACTTDPLQVP